MHYNPTTGVFTRLISTCNNNKVGDIVGSKGKHGYLQCMVDKKQYRMHRLAFLYMTGSIPEEVDHDNRIKDDNRWTNLNTSDRQLNNMNKGISSRNTSGHMGVSWSKTSNKWWAQIRVDGQVIHLGYYTDINDAVAARQAANIKHGFHTNHGIN